MKERSKFVPARIVKNDFSSELRLEIIDKPVKVTKEENNKMKESETNGTVVRGHLGPKCFITTCYFQPKQVPVSYSETMILNIGSNKKKYFESIYYKNILVPQYWSETMLANLNYESTTSEVSIPRNEEFHFMSLEGQIPHILEDSMHDVKEELTGNQKKI